MPIPLAAALIAGSAVVKGASGILGARDSYTPAQRRRLAQLEALRKSGNLGLSDEEIAASRDIVLSPTQAAAREGRVRMLSDANIADVGGGAAAKTAIGEATREQRAIQPGLARIAQTDVERAAQQEAEIQALRGARDTSKSAGRQAVLSALSGGLDAAGNISKELGSSQFLKKTEEAVAEADRSRAAAELGFEMSNDEYNEVASLLAALEG